ncbi:insulinase family protein [Streptomyces sp. NPDC001985]|uniref:M16 family metallopeptidase n=1 Tax=Streptomyces sp. NPDC001985 TaxID=3154406 RepID=UPI00331C0F89
MAVLSAAGRAYPAGPRSTGRGRPETIGVERPGARLAAVRLQVRVGSADEGPGEHGLAHVVEHLVVRSLPAGGRTGPGVLADARTGREHTAYSALVRRADAPAALVTLAAALGELRLPPGALGAELAGIRQETAQRHADPRWRLQEALLGALWAGTSHAHSPLGDPAVLNALTEERVRRFHARWYHPSRATAVVVADRPGEVLTAAGAWPGDRAGHGAPADSAARGAGPAARGVRLALPAAPPGPRPSRPPSRPAGRRTVGLAFVAGPRDPYLRACQDLARRAVRAESGLDVQVGEFGGYACVWAMLAAPDAEAGTLALRRALLRTRERLLGPDGERLLRAGALIPALRAADAPDAVAAGAAGAAVAAPETVRAADAAAVTESWERHIGEIP